MDGWMELTTVTLVAVLGRLAAGSDLESRLGHDLVEGVGAAGEDLAGVAVAQDVALLVRLEGPLPLVVAAVALGLEGGGHCEFVLLIVWCFSGVSVMSEGKV
jgi:hypothetical protein